MTKDEAIALLKRPHRRELRKIATAYTSVIFWAERPGRNYDPRIEDGSMLFRDVGQGTFALTADHVFQGYLDRRAERPNQVSVEQAISRDPRLHDEWLIAKATLSPDQPFTRWEHAAQRLHGTAERRRLVRGS